MLEVAVVDDEQQVRDELSQMVKQYASQRQLRVAVTCYADGAELLAAPGFPDIVLLDIEMDGVDGVSCAHELRSRGCGSQIVFVTNMAQYAIRGYEVNAADFVVKPVSYPTLAFKLDRVVETARRRQSTSIKLETKGGFVRLDVSEILYVEVSGHRLVYHTADGSIELWGTMKDAAATLEPYGFAQCNACYLVNLDNVRGVDGDHVRVGADSLKMSRGKQCDFMDALTRSMRG